MATSVSERTLLNALAFVGALLALIEPPRALGQTNLEPYSPCFATIGPVTYSAANGRLLQRNSIIYLAGRALGIRLDLPSCTTVTGVTTDGEPDDVSHTGGHPAVPWSLVADEPSTPGRHLVTIRIRSAGLGEGRSQPIHITAGYPLITGGGAVHDFTLVDVAYVNSPPYAYSLGEAEILNQVISATWDEVARHTGAKGTPKPRYKEFVVDVRHDGIHLRMPIDIALRNSCDVTVNVTGRMKLFPDPGGARVQWESGPNAEAAFTPVCDFATNVLGPAVWLAKALGERSAETAAKDALKQSLTGLTVDCAGVPCDVALKEITTRDGEILLMFDASYVTGAVSIRSSYESRHRTYAWIGGIALNPGEQVVVVSGGIAEACTKGDPSRIGTCETLQTGPGGLFNWKHRPPIPDPWVLTDNGWAYLRDRAEARAALRGFDRPVSALPNGQQNVAMLLAYQPFDPRPFLMDKPCVLTNTGGREWRVLFSNNDQLWGRQGQGSFTVSLLWLGQPLDRGKQCSTAD